MIDLISTFLLGLLRRQNRDFLLWRRDLVRGAQDLLRSGHQRRTVGHRKTVGAAIERRVLRCPQLSGSGIHVQLAGQMQVWSYFALYFNLRLRKRRAICF